MISDRRVGEGGSQLLERIQDGLEIDSDPEQYDEHCSPQPPHPQPQQPTAPGDPPQSGNVWGAGHGTISDTLPAQAIR